MLIPKTARKIWLTVLYILLAIILLIFLLLGWISSAQEKFPYKSYVIQSGSMEPSIMTGDIIIVKPETAYHEKEVITFVDQNNRVVTHRIIEKTDTGGEFSYLTQGDANQTPDNDTITSDLVKGKVVFVLPKLGFAVGFAKSKVGIMALIGTPTILIIYDELRKILDEAKS